MLPLPLLGCCWRYSRSPPRSESRLLLHFCPTSALQLPSRSAGLHYDLRA